MTNKCKSNKIYTLGALAKLVDGKVLDGEGPSGKGEGISIRGVAGLADAQEGDITFIANPRYRRMVSQTRASAIISSQKEGLFKGPVLQAPDPYLAFAKVLELLHPFKRPSPGIHPNAFVHEEAEIGGDVIVEAGVSIDKGVHLGRGVWVHACTVIREGSQIGDGSCIHPNVTIYPNTQIGKGVIIHAGSVIGSDGFGYAQKEGHPYKVLQVGRVVIEDDCEIGANVTIDRGTLGDTRIGRGSKIDNLVQIGHNVVIGAYSIIVAQVGISGSTQIGNGVILAGQVGVAGHITIGDRAIVAAKSGITKDIKPGATMAGFMAMPIDEWRRSEAVYRNLPELQRRYRELLKRIECLERGSAQAGK